MRFAWILLCAMACDGGDGDGQDDPSWSGWGDTQTDPADPPVEPVEIRVATWNIEALGSPESEQYIAVRDILRRLDADVVGLNEVEAYEGDTLEQLASELGYAVVVYSSRQPFGGGGNAILSRFEELASRLPDSALLSGDSTAKDVTRLPVVHTGRIRSLDMEMTVVAQHWKAGFEESDDFRRAVDGWRTAQAAEYGSSSDFLVVMGDVNGEPEDFPGEPAAFTSSPWGLPSSYELGSDLDLLMAQSGIPNDPFGVLEDLNLERLPATQISGHRGTRPSSGRVIDHIFVSPGIADRAPKTEIYDSSQDIGGSIATGNSSPRSGDSARASDHFPVLMVFEVRPPG